MSIDGPVIAFLAKGKDQLTPCLSIDIDNTVALSSSHMLAVINDRFGKSYTMADITQAGISWLEGQEKQYAAHLHTDPTFHLTMAPDYAAIAAVQAIKASGLALFFTTSRDPALTDVTVTWLQNQGLPTENLSIGPQAKAQVSAAHSEVDPVIFVDDNPNLVADISNPGSTLYLLQRTYTGVIDQSESVKVINEWQDLLDDLDVKRPKKIPQLTEPLPLP